jgi:hypothetical protein
MNLRCSRCGSLSYSASPDVVVRNQARCGECGGAIVRLDDGDPADDEIRGDDAPVSGA